MESLSVERAISGDTNLTQTHKSNVGKSDNGERETERKNRNTGSS